jgi:hypothetical protein
MMVHSGVGGDHLCPRLLPTDKNCTCADLHEGYLMLTSHLHKASRKADMCEG